jgi:GH15 family glucan-1,4-alpha-glucosidase
MLDWYKGGYYRVAPAARWTSNRRYIPETNVLETTFKTEGGVAKLTEFMQTHPQSAPDRPMDIASEHRVVRILECIEGRVDFVLEIKPRFDYGTIVPHAVLDGPNKGFAHGGAAGLAVYCSEPLRLWQDGFRSEGTLEQGAKLCTTVTHQPRFSHTGEEMANDEIEMELGETIQFWREWSALCTYQGRHRDAVLRSALTLKALTYAPSGAILAAATTSLPEAVGGSRNWDYRFCWIRDAAFALYALAILGYREEARAFRDWMEWSTSGRVEELQIMYGLGGERRLNELELPELEGYRSSRPVRIGNGAYRQFQLDIYGELLDAAHMYRKFSNTLEAETWNYLQQVIGLVIQRWREPDEGIWETRGGRQHFVLSKVMCWVAMDRGIKAAETLGLAGDIELWDKVRTEIKEDVLIRGFDEQIGAFVQSYGSKLLDAANLLMPLVGFISATDPRMIATIRATEQQLTSTEGFVYRYKGYDDGISGDEGAFLICSFWLADNLILLGEVDKAAALFGRLKDCSNDLGLLSEEFNPLTGELLGNFPQAFSHMGLISTALNLDKHRRAAGLS